ncbi:MAG: hypothetical protein KAZ71_04920 [Bacteroidia bacterium]|nr:hypothetical protein [Bacteroidia bacterium]
MNKIITLISAVLLLNNFSSYSQSGFPTIGMENEMYYEVHGTYRRSVKKSQFSNAKLIRDVVSGYPSNWISSYVSVEIIGTCAGKVVKASGLNEKLTAEQIQILNTIDLAANLVVNVKYIYNDFGRNKQENNDMHVEMTVVPEIEAEFIGGEKLLINYLKLNNYSKLPSKKPSDFKGAVIKFTINEGGDVINVRTTQKWGDAKTDQLLFDLISKMPKWKPAVNANGVKVKQDFVFSVGAGGC